MKQKDLEQIVKIAEKAGEIIENTKDAVIKLKEDQSPVTTADFNAQEYIIRELSKLYPEAGFLSEELQNEPPIGKDIVFVIDPLDGTKAFVEGLGYDPNLSFEELNESLSDLGKIALEEERELHDEHWRCYFEKRIGEYAVHIGVLEHGIPSLGIVHLPKYDLTFHAMKGKGAYRNSNQIKLDDNTIFENQFVFGRYNIDEKSKELMGKHDISTYSLVGSYGIKLCILALGNAKYFIHTDKQPGMWDYCAGAVILEEAGGSIVDLDGQSMNYDVTKPKMENGSIAFAFHDIDLEFQKNIRLDTLDQIFLKERNIDINYANKFDDRFNKNNIIDLVQMGVDPSKIAQYPSRFDGEDIVSLLRLDISPETAASYPERFDARGIEKLVQADISAETASDYHERFWAFEIQDLVENNISPEIANPFDNRVTGTAISKIARTQADISKYSQRFAGLDLRRLIEVRCPPEEAGAYEDRYEGTHIANLFTAGILSTEANQYDSRFSGEDIDSHFSGQRPMSHLRIYPPQANSYDSRFSAFDIAQLVESSVSPEIAAIYSNRFSGFCIKFLCDDDISPETADTYPTRFQGWDIADLIKADVSPEKSIEYSDRFEGREIALLAQNNITAETARKYNKKFSASDIVELVQADISVETSNEYKRFSGEGIVALIQAGIPLEKANTYDLKYSGREIVELVKTGIDSNKIPQYSQRFDGNQIAKLAELGVSIETANAYNKDFGGYMVIDFIENNVSSELANAYGLRFRGVSGGKISDLLKAKIEPEVAKAYNRKLYIRDIVHLFESNVPPEKTTGFNDRFESWDIVHLAEADISPEEAEPYDLRFNGKTIIHLVKSKISPEDCTGYSRRFRSNDLEQMITADISPEVAASYNDNISGFGMAKLIKKRIAPEKANSYDKRFSGYDIEDLVEAKVSPAKTEKYSKRFRGKDIAKFVEEGISSEQAEIYDDRFVGWGGIADLIKAKVPPESALEYSERFHPHSIAELHRLGCSPNEAEKYAESLDETSIAILYAMNISPEKYENMKIRKKNNLTNLLEKISMHFFNEEKRFSISKTGDNSVVILTDNSAFKFAEDISQEARLLKKVPEKKSSFVRSILSKIRLCEPQYSHVVKYKNEFEYYSSIELQNIKGKDIEELLKHNTFEEKRILKYGYHIFQGLEQLKEAQIYHRDIRPANVMVDEDKDIAIIIDLGIASDDPNAMPMDNRRYGGSDLMGLGQLLYKMATGNNLFNEYTLPSIEVANEIKKLRKDFCYDPKKRVECCNRVTQDIESLHVRSAILTCLHAGVEIGEKQNVTPEQIRDNAYSKVKEMFKRYL